MKIWTRLAPVVALLVLTACASHAPPSLDPAGVKIWQANEANVILGTAQHAAIELNKIQVCPTPPATVPACHPLLSDRNTKIVVEAVTDGITTVLAVPSGWKATALAVLDRIKLRLDAAGLSKFTPYLEGGKTAIGLIQ